MINQNDMLKRLMENDRRLAQTEVKETPPLYLPWAQNVLNPFPLASSGAIWGNQAQPWAVNVLAFYCTVFVVTTNNATNFWTIVLRDNAATTIASFTTAAIAANTSVRFAITTGLVQPAASSPLFQIVPTATLAPGAIILAPAVGLLRTGN